MLKRQLLNLLSRLPNTHDVKQRKALITFTGFDYLVNRIDLQGDNRTFFTGLIEVLISEGKPTLEAFIDNLIDSEWIGLEGKKQLKNLKQEITELNTEHWCREFVGYVFDDQYPQNKKLQQIELRSERGIDYTRLRDLLADGWWQEADCETELVMLRTAGREGKLLNVESIQKFPCSDLSTIDQLWVAASGGHFGFSVQKGIWEQARNPNDSEHDSYCAFGNCVGWRVNGKWLSYEDMIFDIKAPKGHLPQWGLEAILLGKKLQWFTNENLMKLSLYNRVFSKLFYRIKACSL